ncbi:hypothetical protein PENTCL1PPCAC_5717, partial [Pristionchus entomophagus]
GGQGVPIANREEKVWGKSVGMLGNSLPKLAKYSGRKEMWDEFEPGFMIRFGSMDNAVAMSMLLENLEGKAREGLRGIPEEEKNKVICSVMNWLKRRLSDDTPFQEIEWEKKLRQQSVAGRSMGIVCKELERWTTKLHSDMEKKESARRRQLLILYEGKHSGYNYNQRSGGCVGQSGNQQKYQYKWNTSGSGNTSNGTGANATPIGSGSGSAPGLNAVRGMPTVHNSLEPSSTMRDEDNERLERRRQEEEYFFIKKREMVKGTVNGKQVEVLLDTGVDVSIISKNIVESIDGALIEMGSTVVVKDVQGGTMDIIGRTILEVHLEVGKKTPVEFYVVNNSMSKVLIGGKGLEDIRVELREVKYDERNDKKEEFQGEEAIVLRDVVIRPGELGRVWVYGKTYAAVVLESNIEQALEGVATYEKIESIPVMNDTNEDMHFKKHQSVGTWKVLIGAVKGMSSETVDSVGRQSCESADSSIWHGIREKLVKNRGLELENILEKVLKGSDTIQKKISEKSNGMDGSEMIRMPDSTRKLSMA